ncbi:dermonecrotic toxin domain-containing protein [Pseudomonas sp. 18175]|uniref:dermonecrotic toxin domain-containing protein n=1 Tax=Pseudomonas sp. 18175 TaxID=3390056 RepID=UPI003D1F52A7
MNAKTSVAPSLPSPKPLLEKALLTRLTEDGPTSNEVASILLRSELNILYPDLNPDLDRTVVGTPIWRFVDNELTCVDTHYTPLTHVLVRLALENTKANYLQGEHFLTQQPSTPEPVQLPVDIEQIATLLNDLAPVFFVAFKEQQLAFWNATGVRLPRWQELADGLAAALNIQEVEGWNADHCDIARGISMYPDKHQRLIHRPDLAHIQVCLLDIDSPNAKNLKHLMLAGTAIVQGTFKQTDILMMYTLEYGYETFPSLQDLATAAQSRLSTSMSSLPLAMRLVEPEGNFFDHMAWALIATQLTAIETEGFSNLVTSAPQPQPLSTATEPLDLDPDTTRLNMLDGAIPHWLLNASPHDLNDYSQHMLDLSTLYNDVPADLFQLQPIKAFAQDKMRNAILADHRPGTDTLPLDEIQIIRTESLAVGPFNLANPLESYPQTLGEYALSNTPPYQATVSFKGGQTVPDWLTDSYLTRLSEQVDIGQMYPKLIQDKLIDDPLEAPRQQRFYIQQLRSLLPLLALECKLTHTGNVDEQGCRAINELVNPTPDTPDPIVIRPLSIRPSLRISQTFDEVLNIFIIGPRSQQHGPCLLYRPLLENPLIQFPSLQNLKYELHQPGEIRDSILAWLPNQSLSFNYAQYVFPTGLTSAWLISELVQTPLKLFEWGGSLVFSKTELTGDIFAALFEANAKAMAQLADRESLSNAERRWALLEDSAWAIFNAASSFLNGYVATAVWVWQIFNQLQQVLDTPAQSNGLIKWQRLGDVLMALAIVITHKAGPLRRGKAKSADARGSRPPLPAPPQLRALASDSRALPHRQFSILAVEGAVPRRTPTQWGSYLDAFKVEAPDLRDHALPQQRPPLYDVAQNTYAQVDQRWFQVVGDEDANIHILDPRNPSLTGPCLAKTSMGTWRINTDLRLLRSNESLKSKLKASRMLRAQKLQPLEQQREALEQREKVLKGEMHTLLKSPSTQTLLDQSLSKAQELIANREASLKLLDQWRNEGGTLGYEDTLLRLYKGFNTYLMTWTAFKHVAYNAAVERILKNRESEDVTARQQLPADIHLAVEMGREIDAKLIALAGAKHALSGMGSAGAMDARQIQVSERFHTRWELKTNEIASAAELCIREQAAHDMAQARSAVYEMVERATAASRNMTQLLKDDPQEAQLETLSAMVETFQSVRNRIEELPGEFPERVDLNALANLKGVVNEFLLLAQSNIGSRLQQAAPSLRAPAKPSTSKPYAKARVIKKRLRDQPKEPQDVPEQAPLTLIPPLKKQTAKLTGDYIDITQQGLELTEGLDSFISDTRKSALKPFRIPADMQDIFDQQALKMEQTLKVFEPLHTLAKLAGNALPVASLSAELRDGAARLRREGITIRATLLKLRKPQQGYFQWLLENDQVRVTRNQAGRIKTTQFNDYFQEYFILDSANGDQPLWLAHFHYPTLKTPANQFTAAHLKIDDAYLKQLPADTQPALTTRTALDNLLRKLNDPVALAAFLRLEERRR